MAGRPYVLAETTWNAVGDAAFDVAILPWGATEAHNRHLPYGTDTIQVETIAVGAAGLAWEQGARAVVLPSIPLGVQSGQLDIPLTLHVGPTTQAALLDDLAASLERSRIRKLLILNGHGGNDFRAIVRDLQARRPGLLVCLIDWYRCVDPHPFFGAPGDHAGELETSVMMHLAPELVRPLSEAGRGHAKRFRIAGLRDGWAWAPRAWTSVTEDTGVGDPRGATASGGERFVRAVTERIAAFLVELAGADLDDLYE